MLPCKWWQVCHINVKQQWSKDTALGDPLVAREERRRLVVDHYPLLPIVKKISEPAKSCAANATGLQSQEQVLMQNIEEDWVGNLWMTIDQFDPSAGYQNAKMWPNARQNWSPFVLLYWGRPGSTEWISVASPPPPFFVHYPILDTESKTSTNCSRTLNVADTQNTKISQA